MPGEWAFSFQCSFIDISFTYPTIHSLTCRIPWVLDFSEVCKGSECFGSLPASPQLPPHGRGSSGFIHRSRWGQTFYPSYSSELLFCVREPNYLLTPELSATRATGDVFSGMLAALSHGTLHEDFLLCAVGSVERQGLGRSWLCYFLAGRFTSTCLRFFVHKVGSSYGE